MSRHQCVSEHAGAPVTVTLGWDRPLQHFFLIVAKRGLPCCCGPLAFVYDSRLDEHPLEYDLEYFLAKLQSLHVDVPLEMFEQVSYDAMFGGGNRVLVYGKDGTFREPSGEWH